MLIYWGIFLLPALVALQESVGRARRSQVILFGLLFVIWFIMAFRETGGDFSTYLKMFNLADGHDFYETVTMSDPAYMALNWLSSSIGFGLYGVNAACAIIFLFGLFVFIRYEPLPILTLAIAVSYLVIVVAIGYTRQGTAIGLLLPAIIQIRRHRPIRAGACILLAAGFHSTAVVIFPLVYFAIEARSQATKNLIRAGVVVAAIYAARTILSDRADTFYNVYVISDHYKSDGALVRSLSSALAGVFFIMFRKDWKMQFDDAKIWTIFSILSILCVPGSLFASTAVDRMGLYLIPLQLVVFGRLPVILRATGPAVAVGVVAIYATSLFVWLNLGNFAQELWLPYKSLILGTVG